MYGCVGFIYVFGEYRVFPSFYWIELVTWAIIDLLVEAVFLFLKNDQRSWVFLM